jgi:hypothetical protein
MSLYDRRAAKMSMFATVIDRRYKRPKNFFATGPLDPDLHRFKENTDDIVEAVVPTA